MQPPPYQSIDPVSTPRHDISQPPAYKPHDELLPLYTPALENFGLVLVKREAVSPFELYKVIPGWMPCFMELNSTQVNFYQLCPNDTAKTIPSLVDIVDSQLGGEKTAVGLVPKTLSSKLAGLVKNLKSDKQDPKTISNKLFTSAYPSTLQRIPSSVMAQSLVKSYLVSTYWPTASYTLQRASIGVATDVQVGPSTVFLRMRLESEQILIQCFSEESLIDWYFKLNFAKDLSLPLELRNEAVIRTSPLIRPILEEGAYDTRSMGWRGQKYNHFPASKDDSATPSTCTSSSASTLSFQLSHTSSSNLTLLLNISSFSAESVLQPRPCTSFHLALQPSQRTVSPLTATGEYDLELSFIKLTMTSLSAKESWVGRPLVVSSRSQPEDRYEFMHRISMPLDAWVTGMEILGLDLPMLQDLLSSLEGFSLSETLQKLKWTNPSEIMVPMWSLAKKHTARFAESKWRGSGCRGQASCREYIVIWNGLVCLQ
ncbi:hypothetical protein BABINDRAFT_159130 [Babjeviella inositovora NRRL Y-12698]|uniref:PH domain-containing protein n=1 Tax=Babjeviella inositovora NRRL Y-12698 TaxID=984486 RepID=A0A1E3QY80_9ASCO|nr:uncharacterized protein BABINDRAFT_159130 [Babjeviella inositovora NRRL Y-12698]ODQ82571.1 hypothetical protein BABINDRAFT_159130 [Babjeviella inositovora NRRL Y-12698]